MSKERISQQVMGYFLQRATFATNNKQILQQVVIDFLQGATSATNSK